jgi:hypothetical protein
VESRSIGNLFLSECFSPEINSLHLEDHRIDSHPGNVFLIVDPSSSPHVSFLHLGMLNIGHGADPKDTFFSRAVSVKI